MIHLFHFFSSFHQLAKSCENKTIVLQKIFETRIKHRKHIGFSFIATIRYFPQNTILKYILMMVLPLIAVALWGYFAAPKSKHPLQQPYRVLFALAIFGTSVFLLILAGKTMLAAIFASLIILNQLSLFIFKQ